MSIADVVDAIGRDANGKALEVRVKELACSVMAACIAHPHVEGSEARELALALAYASGVVLAELGAPPCTTALAVSMAQRAVVLGAMA